MNTLLKFTLTLLIALMFTAPAFARDNLNDSRRQANSQFRIAEKAYRKAIKDYGENLDGYPDKEKASACKKMSSALYDNRWQYDWENSFNQSKIKTQIQKLETYSSELGCTK